MLNWKKEYSMDLKLKSCWKTTFLVLKWLELKNEHGCFKNVEQFLGNIESPDWKKKVARMFNKKFLELFFCVAVLLESRNFSA